MSIICSSKRVQSIGELRSVLDELIKSGVSENTFLTIQEGRENRILKAFWITPDFIPDRVQANFNEQISGTHTVTMHIEDESRHPLSSRDDPIDAWQLCGQCKGIRPHTLIDDELCCQSCGPY